MTKFQRWVVQYSPATCDYCISNADYDPYGLGAGVTMVGDVYPSGDSGPMVHPNCRCMLIDIPDEEIATQFQPADQEAAVDMAVELIPGSTPQQAITSIAAIYGLNAYTDRDGLVHTTEPDEPILQQEKIQTPPADPAPAVTIDQAKQLIAQYGKNTPMIPYLKYLAALLGLAIVLKDDGTVMLESENPEEENLREHITTGDYPENQGKR